MTRNVIELTLFLPSPLDDVVHIETYRTYSTRFGREMNGNRFIFGATVEVKFTEDVVTNSWFPINQLVNGEVGSYNLNSNGIKCLILGLTQINIFYINKFVKTLCCFE